MDQADDRTAAVYTPADQIRYWLAEERRLLIDAVTGLSEDQAREPLAPGEWSVHDILAHRMFWEGREVEAIGQHLLGRRVELLDFPAKRLDGTNAAAVDTLRARSTAQILRDLVRLRAMLSDLLRRLADTDLNAIDNPARIILGVALEHDREHRRQIEAWRRTRQPSSPAANSGPAE